MTDPQRELYERWGIWRYGWWLLWVKASEVVRLRGSYTGIRWHMAAACLWLSRLFRP